MPIMASVKSPSAFVVEMPNCLGEGKKGFSISKLKPRLLKTSKYLCEVVRKEVTIFPVINAFFSARPLSI